MISVLFVRAVFALKAQSVFYFACAVNRASCSLEVQQHRIVFRSAQWLLNSLFFCSSTVFPVLSDFRCHARVIRKPGVYHFLFLSKQMADNELGTRPSDSLVHTILADPITYSCMVEVAADGFRPSTLTIEKVTIFCPTLNPMFRALCPGLRVIKCMPTSIKVSRIVPNTLTQLQYRL